MTVRRRVMVLLAAAAMASAPGAATSTPAKTPQTADTEQAELVVHRYVLVGDVRWNPPDNPLAVVFVDLGGMRRQGDVILVDVVYALGKPQTIDGFEDIYTVYHHEVACGDGAQRAAAATMVDAAGERLTEESGQTMHRAEKDNDRMLLDWVCHPETVKGASYPSLELVLDHARQSERLRREFDAAITHRFHLVGATSDAAADSDVLVDDAALEREGQRVTFPVLTALQLRTPVQSPARPYQFDVWTADCKVRTLSLQFTRFYLPDGKVESSQVLLDDPGPAPAHSPEERLLAFACEGWRPSLNAPPATTVAQALQQSKARLSPAP